MSVNFTSVKCPECGASLPIEEGRTQVFCSYCGTKVIVTNDNEYIYRHIDEAGVKQAETDRMIRLRQLELEEAQAQQNAKLRSTLMKIWIPVSGIIILIGLGLMFFGGDMGPIFSFLSIFLKEKTIRSNYKMEEFVFLRALSLLPKRTLR